MLTLEAIAASKSALGVDFNGVFVPTDIAWSAQLKAFGELGFEEGFATSLLESSFTAAVQRSLLEALETRLRLAPAPAQSAKLPTIEFDSNVEAQVSRAIASAWQLTPDVPSILGLRLELSKHAMRIGEIARREARLGVEGRQARVQTYGGLDSALVPSISIGLDAAEAAVPSIRGEKWALLFDELELAPAIIRNRILESMRSVDDRLIFKIALSPYSDDLNLLKSAMSSMPGHDYDEISLSYGRKESGLDFTLDLMQSILRARAHPSENLLAVFGESTFPVDTSVSARLRHLESSAENASRQTRLIRELARNDRSFRAYIDRTAGSVQAFLGLRGDQRAQKVRKVLPLVVVRSAFRVPDGSAVSGKRRYNTRKNPQIYAGLVSLATTLEGNPRWIIGVMNTLLDESPGTSVSADRQSAELAKTANRFKALLATIPVPDTPPLRRRGLVAFVDTVGSYFKERVIADDFNPDPVGSFIVDSHASEALLQVVGNALNNGAIVHVPEPGGSAVLTSLRGKRFRLSYLLATEYGLPLRLERDASLLRVISRTPRLKQEALF